MSYGLRREYGPRLLAGHKLIMSPAGPFATGVYVLGVFDILKGQEGKSAAVYAIQGVEM